MINKLAGFFLLSILSFQVLSQTTEVTPSAPARAKSSRPDIPGTISLEFGINRDIAGPDAWKISFFGSRTFNVYYQYDIRVKNTKFFVSPGFGLSLERWYFTNNGIVSYPENNQDSILLVSPESLEIPRVKKSLLVTNYMEVPLEIKFLTNPDDPTRSFKAAIGGRIGYLYDSFEKLKWHENGETNVLKEKHNYNLNRFRYGVSARIGLGNFSIVGYYNLNTLFETDKGLWEKNGVTRVPVNFNTFTVAISLASF